jgi:integrase/recombinase XerD
MAVPNDPDYLKLTLDDFLTSLAQKESYARNTVSAYRNDLNQLLEYLGQQQPALDNWAAVSTSILTDFVNHLRSMRVVKRGGEVKPVAPSTIARKIAALKSFFGYLMAVGVITTDPSIGLEPPKVAKRAPKTLTGEEVDRLLAAPGASNSPKSIRDRALLELLYATGLRVSELVALQVEDIDLVGHFVRVHSDDSSKDRSLPLNEQAAQSLATYLERSRPSLVKNSGAQPALFLNQRGQKLTRQGMWLIIKEYAKQVGLTYDVTPHVLRHSFAAHMLKNNKASLSEVQRYLGHANISTTQIYTQMSGPAEEVDESPDP